MEADFPQGVEGMEAQAFGRNADVNLANGIRAIAPEATSTLGCCNWSLTVRGPHPTDLRNLSLEPYNTSVGGVNMGAQQKDVFEGFIHDEICHDVPNSKGTSHIPAITSVTLKRGQEILAGDWYGCYQAIKEGKPCE